MNHRSSKSRCALGALALLAALALFGCSDNSKQSSSPTGGSEPKSASSSGVCQVLDVTHQAVTEANSSFAQVVTEIPKGTKLSKAVAAGVSFASGSLDADPGEFSPVIGYLLEAAKGYEANADAKVAAPSAEVLDNAKGLDEFLAKGSCN